MRRSNQEKHLLALAKKIVAKETYKNLKKISQDEIEHATKYAIISALEKKYHWLNEKAKGSFTAETLLQRVPSKIQHVKIEFDKDEFYKLLRLLKKIEKECNDVAI